MVERAARLRGTKERGEWAELCFMARAMEEGLRVARPWGETSYDVGTDYRNLRCRVQVKSTEYMRGKRSYMLNVRGTRGRPYKKGSIDFVAMFLIPDSVWYIIPFEQLKKNGKRLCSFHLAVGNARHKYSQFREAWHLLRGESKGKKR